MVQERYYTLLALDGVHMGMPAAAAVKQIATQRSAKRVALIASKTLNRKTDKVAEIAAALGSQCVGVFDQTVEHVPRASVIEATRFLRDTKADLVCTIGGGTPLDTIKVALQCLAANVTDAAGIDTLAVKTNDDGERVYPEIAAPPIRQIAVPTTLSGAEFSDLGGCVDPDTKIKHMHTGRFIGPVNIILDPRMTLHTPQALWLSTGVRALDHAVETLCSTAPETIADGCALYAIRLLGQSLRRNLEAPDDLEARLDSQTAVWLACMGLNRVPYGASHGIGHQLGAVAGVPHGHTSCVMLPHVMRYNQPATPEKQALIADALGHHGGHAADAMAALIADLGQPTRLRDVGVRQDQLDQIAEGSLVNHWVQANPVPLETSAKLRGLLDAAF